MAQFQHFCANIKTFYKTFKVCLSLFSTFFDLHFLFFVLYYIFNIFLGLQAQVQAIQEESSKLQAAYAGDKAMEITNREREVVRAWLEIQNVGDSRKSKLNDTSDLFKFFAMVRNLVLWMDDLMRQMKTSEKPRDVSGVELLMNNHQGMILISRKN